MSTLQENKKRTAYKPKGAATAIGSLPLIDPDEAAHLMIDNLIEIPAWPQLPKLSFKENMYAQYFEGFPSTIINEEEEKVAFDTNRVDGLANFYQKYLDNDLDYFALGKDYASGFYSFIKQIKSMDEKPKVIKGQVTGPISFGLSVKDQNDKAIIYNEQFADVIIKGLSQKAAWQEKIFNEIAPDAQTVIFFDEPYLVSFGSAFVALDEKKVFSYLDECFSAVDGLKGIHVCGGTDWGLIMQTKVDIIHFDAYEYFNTMALYPRQINKFLKRGGILAWGITPHTQKIETETAKSLFDLLGQKIDKLVSLGVDEKILLEQSIISPSCGAGSLSIQNAKKALSLTREVSTLFMSRFFD